MHYAWKKKKSQCKTSFYLKRVREAPVKPKVKVSEGNRRSNYSGRAWLVCVCVCACARAGACV